MSRKCFLALLRDAEAEVKGTGKACPRALGVSVASRNTAHPREMRF